MATPAGLEPAISSVTGWRINPFSLGAISAVYRGDRKPAKEEVFDYRGTLRVPLNTRPLGRLTHTRTVLTAIPHSILYGTGDRTQ